MTPALQGLRAVHDCGVIVHRGSEPAHLRAAVEAGYLRYGRRLQDGHWLGQYTLKIERARALNMLRAATRRGA